VWLFLHGHGVGFQICTFHFSVGIGRRARTQIGQGLIEIKWTFMKYKFYRILSFSIALIFGTTFGLSAQDNEEEMEKLETYSEMQYLKLSDGNKQFTVALTFDGEEDTEPVKDVLVQFYTGLDELRLIAGINTDEEGKAIVKFPIDLPGDTIGKITIIAKIEEHANYGNVEAMASANWGLPNTNLLFSDHRALWTQIAPTWMIITLTVLLTGVLGPLRVCSFSAF
jgi:hypothetical protein